MMQNLSKKCQIKRQRQIPQKRLLSKVKQRPSRRPWHQVVFHLQSHHTTSMLIQSQRRIRKRTCLNQLKRVQKLKNLNHIRLALSIKSHIRFRLRNRNTILLLVKLPRLNPLRFQKKIFTDTSKLLNSNRFHHQKTTHQNRNKSKTLTKSLMVRPLITQRSGSMSHHKSNRNKKKQSKLQGLIISL